MTKFNSVLTTSFFLHVIRHGEHFGRRGFISGHSDLPSPLAVFPHSGILFSLMAEKLDPNEIITLEELAISSMWEITLSR